MLLLVINIRLKLRLLYLGLLKIIVGAFRN